VISYTFLLVLINLQHWFVSILQQVTGEPLSLEPESNCKVSRINVDAIVRPPARMARYQFRS